MSGFYVRTALVYCDEPSCDATEKEQTTTLRKWRADLRINGWVRRRGQDFCPLHAQTKPTGER